MTLDGMHWSKSKWDAINASMTDMEREKGGMMLYLFPLLRYHDRWSQLTGEDFRYLFNRDDLTDNGYLMQVGGEPLHHGTRRASLGGLQLRSLLLELSGEDAPAL